MVVAEVARRIPAQGRQGRNWLLADAVVVASQATTHDSFRRELAFLSCAMPCGGGNDGIGSGGSRRLCCLVLFECLVMPTNQLCKQGSLLTKACLCLLTCLQDCTGLPLHHTAAAAVVAAAAMRHWPRRTRPSTTNVVVFPVPHAPFPSGARWCAGGGIDDGGSASSPAPACACLLTCLTACSHPRPPSGHWATLLANYYTRALRHRCHRRSLHGCFYFLCVLCTPLYYWMAAINRENAAHTGPLYSAVEVGFSVHLIGRLDVSISDRSRLLRVS